MLILLTHAQEESRRTAASLARLGHVVVLSPVLDMEPTGALWPAGIIDGIIATSARAFELLSATPDWPLAEARRLMPLLLVGERTRDRKPDPEERLTEAGFEIEPIEVYAPQPAESLSDAVLAFAETGGIGAVLHYSRRSAENFLGLAPTAGLDLSRINHICISQEAAAPLLDARLNGVLIAEAPNEQAMFEIVNTLTDPT